jgi:glycosyltransferase involved in cell wall biosynthesis
VAQPSPLPASAAAPASLPPLPAVPLVSVIVPSFNHARYLRECVDSVLAQDHPATELIVVDDGSTDGSLDVLKSYGDRLRLLQQQGGRQARARNLALAVARGELVAFLDSDDRWRPGRLSAAVAAFRARPQAALVWADHAFIDAQGRPLGEQRWVSPGGDFRRVLIAGNPICNATVTVRRGVLDEIGGFNEQAPRVCDGAAWLQIAARGHVFVHLPQRVLDYRLHGGNDSARFAPMTHDRDTALLAAAQAYVQHGVVAGSADLVWLRRVLLRQFAFRAAAWVQRQLGRGTLSEWRARACEALGTDTGLQAFARLQAAKHWVGRR